MSVIEKHWQTTKHTIRERSKHMFNNDLFSDVKFVVGGGPNGQSESKQAIPAHKFVLSISSPVFEAMFYGELAETRDKIELPDCEYESLLELFRYIYSDEVILSGSNVMGVLYLAKKYMVPSLADECTKYLQEHLDPSNVFSILPSAQKYEEKNLQERCWKVIDKQTEEAVKSDGFATIERSLLEAVVTRETLSIKEVDLFKAVNLWAKNECERKGLTTDGEIKRRILGELIVKGIRFPVMKEVEFATVVIDSRILTPEEVSSFFKYYNSALNCPVGFLESVRSGFSDDDIFRCCRFLSIRKDFWVYGGEAVVVDFTVDKDIMLHGLCLCGSETSDYSVDLTIRVIGCKPDYLPHTLVSKTGRFSSKLLQPANYHGFEILFDSTIACKKNIKYEIRAVISGSTSWVGSGGVSTVVCSGVTFTFTDDPDEGNGTSTRLGQFPEMLFSLLP